MPFNLLEGFDQYQDIAELLAPDDVGFTIDGTADPTLAFVAGRFGGQALSFTAASTGDVRSLSLPLATLTPILSYLAAGGRQQMGFAVFFPSSSLGTTTTLFSYGGGVSGIRSVVQVNAAGAIVTNGTVVGGTFPTDEWVAVEFDSYFDASPSTSQPATSQTDVRINGNYLGRGQQTRPRTSANPSVLDVRIGGVGDNFIIDDIWYKTEPGALATDPVGTYDVGDSRIEAFQATGDVDVTGLTASDLTTSDFFNLVDTHNDGVGAVDFVTTTTEGQNSIFSSTDTLSDNPDTIHCVGIKTIARRTGAVNVRFDGVIKQAANIDVLTGQGVGVDLSQSVSFLTINPQTTAAFTAAELATIEFGFQPIEF